MGIVLVQLSAHFSRRTVKALYFGLIRSTAQMFQGTNRTLLVMISCLLGACGGGRAASPTSPTSPQSPRFGITGTVTGFQSAPLGGALVEVLDGADKGQRVVADASGKYAFGALASGSLTLQVTAKAYAPATKAVSLAGDMSVDLQLQAVAAQFGFVQTSVVPLGGKPEGTYGGEIVNASDGCAFRLSATGNFLDRNSNVLTILAWSAPPATIFNPGDHAVYEFCCVSREHAAQISNVDVALNWLNRPCS
jgi:hypothetical protein